MTGVREWIPYFEDFIGTSATFPTVADPATEWLVADTSAAGTPTYVRNAGGAILTLAATSEIENVCLYHGDALSFDIDDMLACEMRVKISAMTSGTTLLWGLGSARNDTSDSVTANAWFKMVGADSTSNIVVESDDGVIDLDDKATGQTLSTAYKHFKIDFSSGKKDVRFFINGIRVAASTTFDMSGYSLGLQPMVQIQKTATAAVDAVTIDYVKIDCRRT